ncbi:MAG: NAD(P)/FAD-dependent oxidoreductase [Actinomycetia bacterium]|nr:NAD(P)/FAD-dependent oxidoreductase [Actinomycetes bacterium]
MTETITTDVVVVGGGLGGLSAARHLQVQGYDVVVLEHHSKPGGYAHYFRADGYRFEVALHALDGLGSNGWARPMFDTLGILESVEFNELEPFYTVSFPDFSVTVPTGIDEYVERIAEVLPDERDGVRNLFDAIKQVGHDVARYTRDRASGEHFDQMEMVGRYPAMAMAFSSSWSQFVDRYVRSTEGKALVATLWGYLGLPPSRLSAGQFALTLLSYHTAGAWYPTGGSGAMSFAIKDKIEEHGGDVRLRTTVTAIEVMGPQHVTVSTDKDLVVEARAVVSNASPSATAALLPPGAMEPEWLDDVQSDVAALSTMTVHLGVARDLAADGWDHHEFFDMVGYDFESEYESILKGEFTDVGMIVSNYSVTDPACAPDGKTALVLTVLAPWDHNDVWGTGGNLKEYQENPGYIATKEAAGQILIDRACRLIPTLRDAIEVVRIGTPLTNVRYIMQPGGSIYGREQTVQNMMERRKPTTPIPNVFLAGAWIGGGGMTAAVGSGKSAAKAVHRYLGSTTG